VKNHTGFDVNAAYELFDVLVDILQEYEYDVECFEKAGTDCSSQYELIERARNAIESAYPGYFEETEADA
jgi:hypothetical protein